MSGESTVRTARGSGAAGGPARSGGRAGRALSGLAVALGSVLFLGGFGWGAVLYRPFTVPTDSMAPAVNPGDRVLGERIDGAQVHRGDVVVFSDPLWSDVPLVKRVVAVGGDTVECCDAEGRLSVDGRAVSEPYLRGGGPASPTGFKAIVPGGRLFVLGDNRAVSQDSRIRLTDPGRGSVPRSEVTARIDATVWPPGRMGMLAHTGSASPFAALPGGVSQPGPLRWIAVAVAAGTVLVFGGAACGPAAARLARRR